jgi:hypothetical protein
MIKKPVIKNTKKVVEKKEVKKKRPLSGWQKFVKKHLGSKPIQALPFAERLKKCSEMWKKDPSNPNKK